MTFAELEGIYLAQRDAQGLAITTRKTETEALNESIIPAIGDWAAQRTTLRDFQDLVMGWRSRG